MAEPPGDSLMEEREESMVSPTGGGATLRVAHFLKPSVCFVDGPVSQLPPHSLSSATARSESMKQPSEVLFRGWNDPSKNWKRWVDRMHSLYQSVWKKAGIHDAVMSSTYQIRRNDDLIFGLSERWCSETKSFVFPWGEATVTLEDMIILGGYSVLGESVSKPLVSRELEENKDRLVKARLEMARGKSRKARHFSWMAKFLDSGSEIEHEAFLALWLSRFVFPTKPFDTIGKNVFHIAVLLAGGTKLALAPVVLSSLYRDLSLLKNTIVASNILEDSQCEDFHLSCTVWAPLHLVQVWAWERFPALQPQPTSIEYGKPRMARWGKVKVEKANIEGVRQAIDSAREYFVWRPYSNGVNKWLIYKIYREKEVWVLVQPGLAEEVESLARCLRVSELVGLECIEQYLPHRVAMQFGMDQDIPGWVSLSNASPEVAWNNYNRPISDKKLYIPSRHFEAAVTSQYLEWWNKTLFSQQDVVQGVVKKKKMSVPKCSESTPKGCKIEDNDPDVPPGFPPKSISRVETMDSSDDDGQTLKEMIRKWISDGNSLVGTQLPSLSSSIDGGAVQKMEAPLKQIKNIVKNEPDMDGSGVVAGVAIGSGVEPVLMEYAMQRKAKMVAENATESGARTPLLNTVSINCNLQGTSVREKAGNSTVGECSNANPEIRPGLELEARISKLEKLVARLKAAKGYRFA